MLVAFLRNAVIDKDENHIYSFAVKLAALPLSIRDVCAEISSLIPTDFSQMSGCDEGCPVRKVPQAMKTASEVSGTWNVAQSLR
jgi:hypothetical protein